MSVVLQQVEVYIKKVIAWIERICTAFNRVYDVVKPLFPLIGQMLETAFRNSIQRVIDMLKVLMKWIQNVFAKINSMIESVANIQQAVTGKVKDGSDSVVNPCRPKQPAVLRPDRLFVERQERRLLFPLIPVTGRPTRDI